MFCLPKNQATDGKHQGVLQPKQLRGPPGPWLQQKSTWVVGCVVTLFREALENNTAQTPSSSKIFHINLLLYTPGSAMGGVWPSSKTLSRHLSFLFWCKAYVIILKRKAMSSTATLSLVPNSSMCLLSKVEVIQNLQIFLFFFFSQSLR